MSLAGLTLPEIAALTPEQIAAITQDDIASLSIPQLRHFTAQQFAEFTTTQIAYFTPQQIADLSPANFAILPPSVIAEFTPEQIAAIRLAQAAVMTTAQVAALSPTQVASLNVPMLKHLSTAALQTLNGLTLAQTELFTPQAIADLSLAQFATLVAPYLGDYGPGRLVDVTPLQMSLLTPAEANSLTQGKIVAFSGAAIGALSPAALEGLRTALVDALTGAQLNGMGDAALSDLNSSYLTSAQLSLLDTSAISGLSTQTFDTMFGGRFNAISTLAITGVTIADLQSLSPTQLASFTSAQKAAMTSDQIAFFGGTNPIVAYALSHESDGALTYAGALSVLEYASSGGMTATKFQGLTQVANEITSGKIQATAYVAQIFDDVVVGNSANAWWTGGGTTRVTLGDLSATSTQTQINELIGKWFLGTDMPSFSGGEFSPGVYQAYSLPLFSSLGPQMTDVNQGQTGDCFFLAAVAETAKQDPSLLRNMIVANGNGSYSVEFQVNGQADYVTVNNELPNFKYTWSNGSNMQFANNATDMWVPLIEKAYAQLMEQAGVPSFNAEENSYGAINGGDSNGLTAITGQSVIEVNLDDNISTANAQSALTAAAAAFNAGDDVMIGTSFNEISSNWVDDHMYSVTAINAATGSITLYNPWGAASASNGVAETFTASLAQLQQENVVLEYAVGPKAAA